MTRTLLCAGLLLALVAALPAATVTSNIDPSQHFAWGENVGWINFRGQGTGDVSTPPPVFGLTFASGFAWGENIGWINLGDGSPTNGTSYSNASATDFGVNVNSSTGALSGYAWGENIGWVNFGTNFPGGVLPADLPKVNLVNGAFSGYIWGENIGWISLDGTQNGGSGGPNSIVTAVAPTASQIADGIIGVTAIPLLSDRQPDAVVNAADVVQRVIDGFP